MNEKRKRIYNKRKLRIIKIKLGTVDNKNPKSIYINLSAWGELIKEEEELNYESP